MSRTATRLGMAIAAVLTAGIAGAAVMEWVGVFDAPAGANNVKGSLWRSGGARDGGRVVGDVAHEASPYIVVFDEPALAGYRGEIAGLAAVPKSAKGRAKRDFKSRQAMEYLAFLGRAQAAHEQDIRRALGRQPKLTRRMRHAINAVVLHLTPAEANRLTRISGVSLVERSVENRLDTDLGPALMGAPALWQGSYAGATSAQQGEGIVIGVIDSGINFGSPSFAAVDPVDGYQHVNPLGAGTYLGNCAPGQVDAANCNDKLIGAWDFVCDYAPNSSLPAETTCATPAKYRESPGGTDLGAHGSHTASTAGGNRRDVAFKGSNLRISGVAPRANLVAYDICYDIVGGESSCPSLASVAAINQAVADGVDVINYSVSGSKNAWGDAVALAFLNAADAGIYLAVSAGNSGSGPDTLTKIYPWAGMTAAATTGREGFSLALNVTGPGQVPAELAPALLTESTNAAAPKVTQTIPGDTPVITSPTWGTADDGCSAYPAGTFQGAIAVISRHSANCTFSVRAQRAADAGAIVAVVANYLDTSITSGSATIPLFTMPPAAATTLRNFTVANPGAVTGGISYPPLAVPNVADTLASFSSRGPASTFNLIMPHVTAPGYGILAAVSDTVGGAGDDQLVGLMSGTSMASPHHAGAAALLRQARPTWTAPEILSAIQMTAKTQVFKEDAVTPGTPFDRGAGRIQLDAVRAGLVLNETKANFLAANPATGGRPEALNLASLANNHCVNSCTFRRTFRNTLSFRQTWTASLQGVNGSLSPAMFSVNPGESKTVAITVSTHGMLPNGSWRFGELKLLPTGTGGDPNQPVLRLPIAVSVAPPILSVTPAWTSRTQATDTTGSVMLNVANLATAGAGRLNFALDNTGTAPVDVIRQDRDAGATGFRSGIWTDAQANAASFAADDFTLVVPGAPSSIQFKAFIVSGKSIAAAVTGGFGWAIYGDNGGVPAGNPHTSPELAQWRCTAPANSAGVQVLPSLASTASERTITLDPVAAGCPAMPVLAPGKYWLIAYARTTLADRMAWYATNNGDGGIKTSSATGAFAWANSACTAPTVCNGLAMQIIATVDCGASWMGMATPATGSLLPGSRTNVRLQIDTTGMSPGSHRGYACFTSNDPLKPKVGAGIRLTTFQQEPGNAPQTYTNLDDYAIADATVTSPILVSGRIGNAPATATVSVDIRHTFIGDLKVDLVAPDGTVYTLHNRSGGSMDNLVKTYRLDLSSEELNGTWTLRVNDNSVGDTGMIDSWGITF